MSYALFHQPLDGRPRHRRGAIRARINGECRPAQHRVRHRRRLGLRRRRLLRADENPHAEHRPARQGGHAADAALLGQRGLRTVAVRADDRQASGARLSSQQPQHAAGRTVSASRRHRDAAAGCCSKLRLCHRRLRQVGPGRARQRRPADEAGHQPLVRLLLPGRGPQPLSDVPVGQRPAVSAEEPGVRLQPEAARRAPIPTTRPATPATRASSSRWT